MHANIFAWSNMRLAKNRTCFHSWRASDAHRVKSWACGCGSHLWRPTAWATLTPSSLRPNFPTKRWLFCHPLYVAMGHTLMSPCSLSHTGESLELRNVEGRSPSQECWIVWGHRLVRSLIGFDFNFFSAERVSFSASLHLSLLTSFKSLASLLQHVIKLGLFFCTILHFFPNFQFFLILLLFLGSNCVSPVLQKKKKSLSANTHSVRSKVHRATHCLKLHLPMRACCKHYL